MPTSEISLFDGDMDYLSRLYTQVNGDSGKAVPSMLNIIDHDFSKADEIMFKFENPTSKPHFGQEDLETGVTQNKQQDQLSSKNAIFAHGAAPVIITADKCTDIDSSAKTGDSSKNNIGWRHLSNSKPKQTKMRRDVVNKTIFRIIRRFFHSVLEKQTPGYKLHKKSDLIGMLSKLVNELFPGYPEQHELAHVLSAVMFRREILMSKPSPDLLAKVQVFLDVQSKYTHKLIAQALSNSHFRMIFGYFLEHGISYFDLDENVIANSLQYHEELEKIKAQFFKTS